MIKTVLNHIGTNNNDNNELRRVAKKKRNRCGQIVLNVEETLFTQFKD